MPTQSISVNWLALLQVGASIMVPIIMFIVGAIYQTGLRQRSEMIEKLDRILEHYNDLDRRLSILETEFERIDPHPSQRRRPV